MVKLKLIPYKLRIKNLDKSKRKNQVFEDLIRLDFAKHFQDFINANNMIKIDSTNEKIFNCDTSNFDSKNSIYYGTLGYGDYGYTSEIIDTKTKKVVKKKEINEAEKIRFYYLLKIYNEKAYVLLNQFKHKGVKTQFGKQMRQYFDDKKIITDNFAIIMNPVVSSKLVNIDKLQKLIFIRERQSKDIEGQIVDDIDNSDDEKIIEEKTINLKGSIIERSKQIIEGLRKNYQEKEYIEIDKIKFEKMKIKVVLNDGTHKTIHLDSRVEFNESIQQEFSGDFPNIKTYYDAVKSYFLRVIGDEEC